MLFWPCRIVTPQATYDPAHFRFEHGGLGEVLDKSGQVIETMDGVTPSLVAEGAATGQHNVTQRWQVVASDGTRWLVEVTNGCGCGGTRTTGTNLVELAW